MTGKVGCVQKVKMKQKKSESAAKKRTFPQTAEVIDETERGQELLSTMRQALIDDGIEVPDESYDEWLERMQTEARSPERQRQYRERMERLRVR